YEADDGEVADLVDTIVKTRANAYVPNAKPDAEPLATITLTAIGRPEPETLKVYATADETRLVLRNTESTGYMVEADSLAIVFKPVLSLRKRQVLDIGADTLTRLTITRPDGLVHTFSREQTGPWQLAGHEKFEADALDDLLERLPVLRAVRWLDPSTGPTGNVTDDFGVLLNTADGTSVSLSVDPETRAATAGGVDMPFEVSETLLEKLDAEFHHRTVLPIMIDDIASVTITKDDKSLAITKTADVYVSEGGEEVDQSAAGALFDTLAGLRVQRYAAPLHLRPQDIATTIVIRTNADETHTLRLIGLEDYTTTATIDPPRGNGLDWFTLEPATVEKLTAGLIEAE
ncbi:MAG: hypothetical protein V3U29_05160, partial [Phycisphaeraceae bacterium]